MSLSMRPSRTQPTTPSSPSPKKSSSSSAPLVISGAQRLRPRSLLPQAQARPSSASSSSTTPDPPPSTALTTTSSTAPRSPSKITLGGSLRRSFGGSTKGKGKESDQGRGEGGTRMEKEESWEVLDEDGEDDFGRFASDKGRPSQPLPPASNGKGVSRIASFSRTKSSKVSTVPSSTARSPSPRKKKISTTSRHPPPPLPPTSPTSSSHSRNSNRLQPSSSFQLARTPQPPSAFASSLANVPGTPNSPSPMTRSSSGSLIFVPSSSTSSSKDPSEVFLGNRSVSNPISSSKHSTSSSSLHPPRPSSSSGKENGAPPPSISLLPSATIHQGQRSTSAASSSSKSNSTLPSTSSNHRPKSSSPNNASTGGRPFPASSSISSIPVPPTRASRGHKVSLSLSQEPSLPSSSSSSIPIAPRARPSSFISTLQQPLPPAARTSKIATSSAPKPKSTASSSSASLMPFPSERREGEKDRAGSPTLVLKKNGSIGRAAGATLRQMPRGPLSMVGGEMPKGLTGVAGGSTPVRERTGTGAGGALMMVASSSEGGGLSMLPNRSHLSYPSPAPPHSSSSSSSVPHPHPRNPLLSFSTATAPSPHSTDSSSASTPTSVRLTPSGASIRSTPKLVPRSSLYDYEAMRDAASLPEDQSLLIEDLEEDGESGWDAMSIARNSILDTPGGGFDASSLRASDFHQQQLRRASVNSNSGHSQSRRHSSSTNSSDVFTPPLPNAPPLPLPTQLDRNHPSYIPIHTTHLLPSIVSASPSPAEITSASLQSRLSQSLLAQADLQKTLSASKGKILDLESKLAQAQAQTRQRDDAQTNEALASQLQLHRAQTTALESEKSQLEEELEAAKSVIDTLETQLLELERSHEELRFSLEAVELEKGEVRLEMEGLERECEGLRQERRERMAGVWEEVGRKERDELEVLGEERAVLGVLEKVLEGLEEGLRLRCVG